MKKQFTTTAICLLTILIGPGCTSADSKGISLDKAVLLDEVILSSIEVESVEPIQSLDRVYLVGYDEKELPICSRYKQRISRVDWIEDQPVGRYEIDYEHPYQCPEQE